MNEAKAVQDHLAILLQTLPYSPPRQPLQKPDYDKSYAAKIVTPFKSPMYLLVQITIITLKRMVIKTTIRYSLAWCTILFRRKFCGI